MTAFCRSYLIAALWSSVDDQGHPLDDAKGIEDIAPETIAKAESDCAAFQAANAATIEQAELADERAGHCFWLNRNGHGSGFWDEYSQTTCDAYEAEQAAAILSRDFSKRDALDQTCPCKYHACQRLSDVARAAGSVDLYIGDDGRVY